MRWELHARASKNWLGKSSGSWRADTAQRWCYFTTRSPTIRNCADLNYIPIVVTDACGSMTPELKAGTLHSFETTGEVLSVTTTQITSLMARSRERARFQL